MKYIVYKTTCLINEKIYIGVHQTENPDEFDGYLGNSLWVNRKDKVNNPQFAFHFAVQKYGANNFKRETLFVFDTPTEAYQKEAEIVTLDFIKQDNNYNVAIGGKGGSKVPRPVFQFDFNGMLLHSFPNGALDAAKTIGGDDNRIRDAILQKSSSYGYLWANTDSIDVTQYTFKVPNKYYVYDADGNYIQMFNSLKECWKYFDTDSSHINLAIRTCGKVRGYFISTEKYDKLKILVTPLSGKLNRYTPEGKYIDSFNTIQEAREKLGLKLCSISTAIKLQRINNGYRWTRTDYPTPTIEIPKVTNHKRKVAVYSKDDELIEIFNSVTETEKKYPGCRYYLKRGGKQKGLSFKYYDN